MIFIVTTNYGSDKMVMIPQWQREREEIVNIVIEDKQLRKSICGIAIFQWIIEITNQLE